MGLPSSMSPSLNPSLTQSLNPSINSSFNAPFNPLYYQMFQQSPAMSVRPDPNQEGVSYVARDSNNNLA